MKKVLAIILSAAMVLCLLASCGSTEETAETTAAVTEETAAESSETIAYPYMNINDEPYVVTAEDGFDNFGITALICDTDDTYAFTSGGSDATWSIYVLDSEFTDGARYLPQAETPALRGNGRISIRNGQYVYIQCSCSSFTDESASDAYLEITRADSSAAGTSAPAATTAKAAAATTAKAAATTAKAASASVKSGEYYDEYSQRASAEVSESGGKYSIRVFWSSSAFEMTEWVMTAELENGKLVYSDCTKMEIYTSETEPEETVTDYENGSGYFEVKDGKLYWTGSSEPSCRDCVFSMEG